MASNFAVPAALQASSTLTRSRWLSVISHLDPRYGGLSAVVPQLASSLAEHSRFDTEIAAFCLPGEEYQPATTAPVPVSFWPTSRKAWLVDRALTARFRSAVSAAPGVHIHGLWEQSSLAAAQAARATHTPYLVSAHGMLEPWALAQGRAKKQLYAGLFERPNLNGAACLHALTTAEARHYRAFGCTAPIAVIPNAVAIPATPSGQLFLEAYPLLRGRRILLFLGRLHAKKGIDMLLRAWAAVRAQASAAWNDAVLVVAGPGEEAMRLGLEELAGHLGLRDHVTFAGMLGPAMKWSSLAAAECFVLPSFSEGLSMATLEAMGVGLPVIVTTTCNLPEVDAFGTGWQVEPTQAALAEALAAWLQNTPEANSAIGQRGTALVHERFSWQTVTEQMAELYSWVEGGREPRSFTMQAEGAA